MRTRSPEGTTSSTRGLQPWLHDVAAPRLVLLLAFFATAGNVKAADEDDYYRLISIVTSKASTASRSKQWKPAPKGLTLEVSGMAALDDGRLAVTIRKGEVWILDNVYKDPPDSVTYNRFATALHEPLGLIKHGDSFYTAQRSELTRLRDTDGDHVADEYLTVAKGWGVTGNYHEYAFGPKLDRDGNFWITLNLGLGLKPEQKLRALKHPTLGVMQGKWRGWSVKITPDGKLIPVSAGMRSPSGLGANRAGDMFYTDQQGNWVGTNTLHHMREGAFHHHPEALASADLEGSPLKDQIKSIPAGLPFPEAVKQLPQLKPPTVWFPYKKVGQSATDIMLDNSGGKFGPFDGQLFIGEFTLASVSRVFLEKVNGQYQGACFPFREGLASAVIRLAQGTDGSTFVGLSNRGWSSIGTASYGLQRLVWTGKKPFEIKEMRARADGFELVFTKPVDHKTASDPKSYSMNSYTYMYHQQYGSDEILKRDLIVQRVEIADNGLTVRLFLDNLRPLFVHELHANGVRSQDDEPLLHPDAYYTLNAIPKHSD